MELIYGFIYYLLLGAFATLLGVGLYCNLYYGSCCYWARNFIAKRRANYHSRKADEFTAYSIQLQLHSTKYAMCAMQSAIKSAAIEREISERRYQRSRAAS